MVHRRVHCGEVGVSHNATREYILLAARDLEEGFTSDARICLTPQETVFLINRLQEELDQIQKFTKTGKLTEI